MKIRILIYHYIHNKEQKINKMDTHQMLIFHPHLSSHRHPRITQDPASDG
jgi:hypothetical protein